MALSKPISRAAFLGAKLCAYGMVFLLSTCLAGLLGYYYLGVLFEWLEPFGFLALNGLLLIYFLMYIAITLLASTIARSQSAAAGMSFGVLILLGLLGVMPSLATKLPAALMSWGRALALGSAHDPSWVALALSLGIVGAAWFGGHLILRRQEI